MRRRSWFTSLLMTVVVLVLVVAVAILAFGPEKFSGVLKIVYKKPYNDIVLTNSRVYNVEENLIYAVMYAESKFDEDALSDAGAKGLMQVTDSTYDWVLSRYPLPEGVGGDILTPEVNIHVGVGLLRILIDQFEDLNAVFAAYNAGIGNVSEWLQDEKFSSDGVHIEVSEIPFAETRHYVRRINDSFEMYEKLYGSGAK